MGGLKINTNAEVLNCQDQVIAGLFACGEVAGGIHASNRLGGNSLSSSLSDALRVEVPVNFNAVILSLIHI